MEESMLHTECISSHLLYE